MKKPSRRKCKVCNDWFHPAYSNVVWCNPEHGAMYALRLRQKEKKKAEARRVKIKKEKEKADRQQLRERRIALKTKSQWRKEAQDAFNRYVRLRDTDKPCISCGRLPEQKLGGTMDCGHYRTRGAASHLAFNLHNTAAQCVYCNRDRAGAQKDFEQGLIVRIGAEAVEALNNDNTCRTFDIPYLQRIKSIFTRKARALEKRRTRQQEHAA
ncbi:recombination protein NinG [Erwinia sp. S38]|uniref:recombination protein NinG n=1 Tax=Erwinia sp. S38 TaxID=2769338 RepID=UPI00190A62A4|nr:recombination protein NinG [Erwinia sp. S38]MBK0003384.1 recombination protein NinG [Erwinia sp. S38]